MTGNCHVRFGGGRLEKCHSGSNGNSLAAYPTPTPVQNIHRSRCLIISRAFSPS